MSIASHSTAPGSNVIVEHYCSAEGCSKWGGFGLSSGRSNETVWWCWEDYPYKKPSTGPVSPR